LDPNTDPNLYLWLTGPDPGGPKTYGSYLQSLGAIRYIAIPHTVAVEEEIHSKNIEINSDRGSEHERKIFY
jgi:hypothetical protein